MWLELNNNNTHVPLTAKYYVVISVVHVCTMLHVLYMYAHAVGVLCVLSI